jgi:hypothetical protein
MKVPAFCASAFLVLLFAAPPVQRLQASQEHLQRPIVAVVKRTNGHLSIAIRPNMEPGSDPLRVLDALRRKYGAECRVIAVVDDNARITDLYQVSGIANKAGLENIRTFIHNRNNGRMFEVTFGPAIPFSPDGPFDGHL